MPHDTYADDRDLSTLVPGRLPAPERAFAAERLDAMGRLAATRLVTLAAESDRHPPILHRYDARGDRIDRIETSEAWREIRRLAYGSGLPGLHHDEAARKASGGNVSRTLVFALTYIYGQAELSFLCPVCLTDGTAWLIERYATADVRDRYLPRLLSLDPERTFDGAMWLTEIAGGSDVGAAEAEAVPAGGGAFRITGRKWFSSNAGADVAMVLARPRGAPAGTDGLGLYALPRLLPDGGRNAYVLERLKDKLGTRGLPTGEIELRGALAYDCGGPGLGFRRMVEMLTLSRIYNAICSAAVMAGACREAATYLKERVAFGRPVAEHPLARRTLARMYAMELASRHLALESALQLDRTNGPEAERKAATACCRSLTPIAKAFTARRALEVTEEAIECLGGNGYVEDWPVARMHRDAQVLPVWEGTSNVLALDLLRAAEKKALGPLFDRLEAAAEAGTQAPGPGGERALVALRTLRPLLTGGRLPPEASMRDVLDRLAVAAAGALLAEAAVARAREGSGRLALAAALLDPARGVVAPPDLLDTAGDLAYAALVEDKVPAEEVRALAPRPGTASSRRAKIVEGRGAKVEK